MKLYSERGMENCRVQGWTLLRNPDQCHFAVIQRHLNSYLGWRFFANRCGVEARDHVGITANLKRIPGALSAYLRER